MNAIWNIALKDIRILVRDRQGLFFAFMFPVIFAIFFGMLFSGAGGSASGIPIVFVDEDQSAASAQFAKQLEADTAFSVSRATTREQAQELVKSGDRTAMVVAPKGFGEASERIFWGDPMRLLIGVDPARKAEAGMIEGLLTAKAYQRFQAMFTDRNAMQRNTKAALDALKQSPTGDAATRQTLQSFLGSLDTFMKDMPADEKDPAKISTGSGGFNPVTIEKLDIVRKREGPQNYFSISFPQAIVWGIMGCAASFGISIVTERTRGTLIRLRMAPLSGGQILAGKGLACLLTTLGVFAMLVLLSLAPPFNVRPESWPLLLMAAICVCFGFVGIMMVLSVLGKTERAVSGVGWAILTVLSMIGGGMVPLFILPPFMQTASGISPIKWSILAFEGAIWRGFTFQQMLLPCGVMVAIGIAGMLLGSRAMRTSSAS